MTKSGFLIEEIVQNLNAFRQEIKSTAKLGLLNQNIHAENFIKDLLNITYKLNLKSLNDSSSNFPGLDLGDEGDQSIAFQITSRKDSKKINETLSTCIDKELYTKYKTIKFFILSEKQKSYKGLLDTTPHFKFNSAKDILDFDDLFIKIKGLKLQNLEEISDLVSNELPKFIYQKNNIEIPNDYPTLRLSVTDFFKINLSDEELEVFLMELDHFFETQMEGEVLIHIDQENSLSSRLNELKSCPTTVSIKRELIEIKIILEQFSKLKAEIQTKLKMLHYIDKYPISKAYGDLVNTVREIIEKLSFPHYLLEETTYLNYFPLNKAEQALKFQGDIKFDVYKNHKSGNQLGCSVWLSKEEVIEIKNRTSLL